ncbi:MAG: phosphoglucosamine mutase [Rhodothermales bacterium]|nr:phosphoglucosamine mutase [Rhodothermales bacterium]
MKTLMVTISGVRGIFGAGLDAATIVRFAGAYGTWTRRRAEAAGRRPLVVVGRDARVTGDVCARLVTATLQSVGCDVLDAGLATTPTVEMGVVLEHGSGGIILSASHNPAQWNALKLLNETGEFLDPDQAREVIALADEEADTVSYDRLGSYEARDLLDAHIDAILNLDFIDRDAIARRGFRVAVDGINSVGAIALPRLLDRLGVTDVTVLNGEPNGLFAHNPEPLPAHLTGILDEVRTSGADLGLVVDPDADRLAFVADGGDYVSEELTQVLAADMLWRVKSGPFVTNLSSSRAIEDVAARYGEQTYRSAVGEVNVVVKMHEVGAALGGEGNGGVILPDLHHGRDALAGTAMILSHLATTGQRLSEWVADLPDYRIAKHKLSVDGLDAKALLAALATKYAAGGDGIRGVSTVDGVKVDLADGWVHVRASNTEPILRIYAEAPSDEAADALAERFKAELLAG